MNDKLLKELLEEREAQGNIKIELKKQVIPIEIGTYKYDLDVTDKGLEEIKKSFIEYADLISNVKDDENFTKVLEESFDSLLEPGAYKNIYSQVQSKLQMVNVLEQLTVGIIVELTALNENVFKTKRKYTKRK